MDPTLINFSLTDLGSVGPWGAENRLHWFGLTDGSYWMQAGPSTTLFQYTTAGGPRNIPSLRTSATTALALLELPPGYNPLVLLLGVHGADQAEEADGNLALSKSRRPHFGARLR